MSSLASWGLAALACQASGANTPHPKTPPTAEVDKPSDPKEAGSVKPSEDANQEPAESPATEDSGEDEQPTEGDETNDPSVQPIEKRTPKLQMGVVLHKGELASELIVRSLRRGYMGLRICYDEARERDPDASASFTATFTIGSDGTVSQVESPDGLPDESGLTDCVLEALTVIKFPPPDKGVVSVSLPLTFSSH